MAFFNTNDKRIRELSLFTGGGGGVLGSILLNFRIVCAVEIDPYCREILLRRQEEKILEAFPIWDDIRTFDGKRWRGFVDVVTGGFPCQPFSVAGRQKAESDERNMWPETVRIISEVRPRFCLLENVRGLLAKSHGYFGQILADLADSGYHAIWKVLSAAEVGAPHRRDRLFIFCYLNGGRSRKVRIHIEESSSGRIANNVRSTDTNDRKEDVAKPGRKRFVVRADKAGNSNRFLRTRNTSGPGSIICGSNCTWWKIDPADLPDANEQYDDDGGYGTGKICRKRQEATKLSGSKQKISDTKRRRFRFKSTELLQNSKRTEPSTANNWYAERSWPAKSFVGRVAHGVANRVDRLKTIGNGQVPTVVATAWNILYNKYLEIQKEA